MPEEKLRADKWLWQARFFKSRAQASAVAGSGRLRVNGARIAKAAHAVRPGDVLTFPQGRLIRVVRVEALGTRRGPASEAATLYSDLDARGRPEQSATSTERARPWDPPRTTCSERAR